ncbi:MAG TPA: type II secretion system F family protein [Candidatus Saccharimonadales bacterium]
MLTYNYTARDPATGQRVKADVQAENEQSAAKLIHKEGLVPLEITLSGSGSGKLLDHFNRVAAKDKVLFSRQLATLINAGLPLVQSLRNVAEQTVNKKFKVIINHIIADVEGGSSLSVSMSRYPEVFSQVYLSLIAAGETSGTLDKALERLAVQQEKDADLVSKIRGAMIYPIIVVCVMIAVVGFMIIKVVPQVKMMYTNIAGGASLPLITRILLAVSDFAIHDWWIVAIILVLFGFFGTRWARTLGGKQVVDSVKMKVPPIGPLFMKVYMARFSRTATTLVASGVPLLQVLQITSDAVNNVHIQHSIRRAADRVKGGKSLSDSLQGDPNFLPLVPSMIHIGEESGSLEKMLAKTADYYENEVDNEIKSISTLIEPVLMVVLGVVAFIIVAAVLLPIYGLANQSFTGF